MKVLIAGGSGFLGRAISKELLDIGHEVAWLSRSPKVLMKQIPVFVWNPADSTMDSRAWDWAEAVINLAGESIGDTPWTEAGKSKIRNSRLQAVQTLRVSAQKHAVSLKAFVGVSGAGYYGNKGIKTFVETDGPGGSFPALVALDWEKSYAKFEEHVPCGNFCVVRLAVVLDRQNGALPRIQKPFSMGFGATPGTGRQPFNWIHVHDAARLFVEALNWSGTFNFSAPELTVLEEVSQWFRRRYQQWIPQMHLPAWGFRLAMGERSGLILEGNHSNVQAILSKGFTFQFPKLVAALEDLFGPLPK